MRYDAPNLTDSRHDDQSTHGRHRQFVAGEVSEDGLANDVGWTANNYTELLFSLDGATDRHSSTATPSGSGCSATVRRPG